jgi:peptidyl-prolyl cis-trans isomerase SurA
VKVRFLVASVLSIVVLSGCSSKPQLAGAAAIVGDTRISQAEVAEQANEVLAEIKVSPAAANAQAPTAEQLGGMIVDRLVFSVLLHKAGETNVAFSVTPKQVQAFRDEVYAQYGQQAIADQLLFQNGISKAHIEGFIEDVLIQQTIARALVPSGDQNAQSQAVRQVLEKEASAGVQISPRYGAWDPASLQRIPGDNSLSFPAAPAS